MKCSIKGCPGEYEERKIAHTIRFQMRISIIDHVPAKVCSVCGDVLLGLETVEQIEAMMMRKPTAPAKEVPLFEYAGSA